MPTRLIDPDTLVAQIDEAVALCRDDALLRRLIAWRTEVSRHGFGLAHIHVRINEGHVLNAIRSVVPFETHPDDPRSRSSNYFALNALLQDAKAETINFGSLLAERNRARSLFMTIAQMLKYVDAKTPVRFLIAECESPFTVLAAVYYAKLFGIDDKVDISPLFETRVSLRRGSRIIDTLLANPHYRDYVQRRGRLCVQTGFSDAGRYIGQTPASASIERLRERICKVFQEYQVEDVEFVCFDTHGDSIGRGAHPGSVADRLDYVNPPRNRRLFERIGVPVKQEVSFQGGDGFVHFLSRKTALAVTTRVAEHVWAPTQDDESDAYYQDRDFIREFFQNVADFQHMLKDDPNYGVLLSTFCYKLFFPSGSRAVKRQDGLAGRGAPTVKASSFRAIPHNATLQQLGLLVNSIGGLGHAIGRRPERFHILNVTSPRFRHLLGIVQYGVGVSDVQAFKAYIAIYDPSFWLAWADRQPAGQQVWDLRRVAQHLDETETFERCSKVFRKIYHDFSQLDYNLSTLRIDPDTKSEAMVLPSVQVRLAVLHALRIALIGQVFRLTMQIPERFAIDASLVDDLTQQLLHLDVPGAVEQIRDLMPADTAGLAGSADFGEQATYLGGDEPSGEARKLELLEQLTELHREIRRVGSAITQFIGFLG